MKFHIFISKFVGGICKINDNCLTFDSKTSICS